MADDNAVLKDRIARLETDLAACRELLHGNTIAPGLKTRLDRVERSSEVASRVLWTMAAPLFGSLIGFAIEVARRYF